MKTSVAVIGNGTIGHGVAEVFATSGHDVVLVGRDSHSLERALAKVSVSVGEFVERGLLSPSTARAAIGRIRVSTDILAASDAEFVVEALPEDMQLKVDTFTKLDSICSPAAILATASGHPVSAVAGRVSRPGRLVATHFWNPPQLLPLVEVCGLADTSPRVIEDTCTLLRGAGKEPVVVDREVPGFIGNRLQFALLREAWALWADGVASANAIDAVVRHSIGRRLAVTGPLESADLGGLLTMVKFAEFLQPKLNTSKEPPQAVRDLMVEVGQCDLSGVSQHSESTRVNLIRARRDELFRWFERDREFTTVEGDFHRSVDGDNSSGPSSPGE